MGPDQLYVAPGDDALERNNVESSHNGIFLLTDGAMGIGRILTITEPLSTQPFNSVCTQYSPDQARTDDVLLGSDKVDVKPPGPVQLHVSSGKSVAVNKVSVWVSHTGGLCVTVTIGRLLMLTRVL